MDFASIEKMIKINLSVVIKTPAAHQRGVHNTGGQTHD